MHCILWPSMPCSAAPTCRIEIPEVAAGINARTGAVASRILVAWCNRDYHRHILFCRYVTTLHRFRVASGDPKKSGHRVVDAGIHAVESALGCAPYEAGALALARS